MARLARPLLRASALILAVGLVGGGCGKSGPRNDSLNGLAKNATQVSLLQAQSSLQVGTSRFVFGLVLSNNQLVAGGSPVVWAAKTTTDKALGPFHARWITWSTPRGDSQGKPPVPGYYVADVTVPSAGNWQLLALSTDRGHAIGGVAGMPVTATPLAAVGSPAVSEPTPVATNPQDAAKIDTREPPTTMHYISLDAALKNGLPTVLVFATPLLCQSRLCGPVVDEVYDVYDKVGTTRANFVDVEIYPSRDANKPAPEVVR